MNAVDTNVLIYAQDPRDRKKQQTAISLIRDLREGVLLWQVSCEYLAASRKLAPFGFSVDAAWDDLSTLRSAWMPALPTWNVQDRAGQIVAKFGCSIWDALLIAACAEADVNLIYSEDFSDVGVIEGVQVVNPFGPSR